MLLGEKTTYQDGVNPKLLQFIPRSDSRKTLKHRAPIGEDLWRVYEFSWLTERGSPEDSFLTIRYDQNSKNIVESKSLKLYLGGFAMTRFASKEKVKAEILKDVGQGLQASFCSIDFYDLQHEMFFTNAPKGYCIDIHDLRDPIFEVTPSLLRVGDEVRDELMHSNSFRSLCPVTGQPDWATVFVLYKGKELMPDSLRAYLCSYRKHQGFHESCCEMIYSDIMSIAKPEELAVGCSFTRRGGIDINPLRSSHKELSITMRRLFRQ